MCLDKGTCDSEPEAAPPPSFPPLEHFEDPLPVFFGYTRATVGDGNLDPRVPAAVVGPAPVAGNRQLSCQFAVGTLRGVLWAQATGLYPHGGAWG